VRRCVDTRGIHVPQVRSPLETVAVYFVLRVHFRVELELRPQRRVWHVLQAAMRLALDHPGAVYVRLEHFQMW